MLDQFKRLGRHSVIYGLSNALAASMSLLLLPLLTRYLRPAEYGALDLSVVFAAQLAIVLQLGLGSAVFKFVLQSANEHIERGLVIATAYYGVAAFALVVSVSLGIFAPQLGQALLGSPAYAFAVVCVLIKAFCEAVSVIPMARLRIREESVSYGALNVGRLGFSVIMFSLILIAFHGGFRAVMIGVAVESAVFLMVSSATAMDDLRSGFSAQIFRGMLAFGLPLVPLAFGLTALSVGDRYVLRQFTSLEEVGRYAVANKIAAALNILIRAFQIAWPAALFSAATQPNAPRFYSRLLTYLVFVLTLGGLAVSVFARDLVAVFAGESFRSAYTVVPLLAVAQIAFGLFYGTAVGSNLTGKTHYQTISVAVALIVFFGLCYVLIPGFGMLGAAIASASGYATLTGLSCALSLSVYPIRYEWERITVLFLVAGVLAVTGLVVETGSVLFDLFIKVAIVAFYPALLYAVGFLDPSERKLLRKFPSALLRADIISQRAGSS